MTVFIILGVLFLSLIIVIPLLERSKMRISEEDTSKFSRWILPLVLIITIANFVMLMMRD